MSRVRPESALVKGKYKSWAVCPCTLYLLLHFLHTGFEFKELMANQTDTVRVSHGKLRQNGLSYWAALRIVGRVLESLLSDLAT